MQTDYTICCEELSRRHPNMGLAIRRLVLRDPRFRAICEDYGEAVHAAKIHQSPGSHDNERVLEYRQIAADLLIEARQYLDDHCSQSPK